MISLGGISLTSQENSSMQRLKNLDVSIAKKTDNVIGSDSVDISDEARQKLATDIAASLLQSDESTTATSADYSKSVDEMIEELKEKIRLLMQEIARLRTKGDEASQKQVKALETDLAMLHAQLLELMNQKLEEKPQKT